MRPRGLVQGHDDGHHVLAVEDGRRQNVPGGEIRQLVHEGAEVLVLKKHRCRRHFQDSPTFIRIFNPQRSLDLF